MGPLSRCTRQLLALKKGEALMSMTRSNDKYAGFLGSLITIIYFIFFSWGAYLEVDEA